MAAEVVLVVVVVVRVCVWEGGGAGGEREGVWWWWCGPECTTCVSLHTRRRCMHLIWVAGHLGVRLPATPATPSPP